MIPNFTATSYDFTEYIPATNFIGGEWCEASGTETLPVINPRWGKAMSSVRLSTAADVDAAAKAAKAAFQDWKQWPIRERAHIAYKARELMLRDFEELSWLVCHENGKVIAQASAEVAKGIECLENGCSLANMGAGEKVEVSRGVDCEVRYEPLGVVAGIAPFNFPFMVPLWMLPQALVGGNAFILKPSEQVPLSSLKLAAIFQEAGLPDGVLNLVNGGREAVEAMCDHPDIKAQGFVGSTTVAKLVYGRACSHCKRALCLGGAKNYLLVVPDADLEVTADNVAASFTGCSGQRCMAAAVLVAIGDVDHIIDEVVRRAATLRTGIDMGPITSEAAVKRITGYIDQAEEMGAKVLLDGRNVQVTEEGYWVGPTIIDHATTAMPAATEEIFGPVLTILRVDTLEEAIALENAIPYGNASSIYTTSGDIARRVMAEVDAGMCGVNIGVPVPREPFGFGGWNDSKFGHGNISGWDGFRFWTRPRKITTKWALQKDQTWMG